MVAMRRETSMTFAKRLAAILSGTFLALGLLAGPAIADGDHPKGDHKGKQDNRNNNQGGDNQCQNNGGNQINIASCNNTSIIRDILIG